jgi:hypothetical protein
MEITYGPGSDNAMDSNYFQTGLPGQNLLLAVSTIFECALSLSLKIYIKDNYY